MTQDAPMSGRVVGRYLLCDEIAAGGMATVHIGRLLGPVGFARTVAIKRLHAHFAKDPEFVAMFMDEARIAARVRHPNVVSTLDIVVLKGEMLVVMEYVHGEPLSRLIRAARATTGRGVPVPIALSVMSGALYGLHAAHDARDDHGAPLGIVHRDVSPQNVLVGQDGIARVVDFGVAKATGRLQSTRDGALKGKLAYMAPEQVASDQVDRRTDVYAASIVLWEMLTGQRLFAADNEVQVLNAVVNAVIPPPSHQAPWLPPEIDALVMKGLCRDPAGRFASAGDMAEAAQRIAYATPGQISAWVKQLGGAALDQRAARVVEIESNSSHNALRSQSSGDLADYAATHVRRQPETPPPPPPSPENARTLPFSTPAIAAAGGAPPAEPISALTTLHSTPPEPYPSQVSSVNLTSPLRQRRRASVLLALLAPVALTAMGVAAFVMMRSGGPPPPAVGGTTPALTASASAAAPPPPSDQPPAPAEPTATASASASVPSAKAQPSTRPAPPRPGRKPSCNPPYTTDARGVRVPKMECL